jgi:DNA-binding NarL/FixJ family response regulator
MKTTKILIVDDHPIVIEGIKNALHLYPEFEVVGEAHDGREAVECVKRLEPDIVSMDVSMPDLNGVEATKRIKHAHPDIQIVIYTMYAEKDFVLDLFKMGVSAYILKENPLSDLMLAFQAVKRGKTSFGPITSTLLVGHMQELETRANGHGKEALERLSRREREVFPHLAEGKSIKEIAGVLYISPKTVATHKYNIMEKLHAVSVVDLTKLAIKQNLITV